MNNPRKHNKPTNPNNDEKGFKIIDGKSILGESYMGLTGRKKKLSEKRAEEEALKETQKVAEEQVVEEATQENKEVLEDTENTKGEE